jgi:hypothetical protein
MICLHTLMQIMKAIPIHLYNDINFDNIRISEFDTNRTAQIGYFNEKLQLETSMFVQTDMIKITSYGMKNYNQINKIPEYIDIPLDPNQLSCIKLREHLEQMDTYFGSDQFKEKILGKQFANYKYLSCIEETKNYLCGRRRNIQKTKIDKCRMKFNMIKNDGSKTNITKLIKIINGKKIPITVETIMEIVNNITFGSEIRLVFNYHSMWTTSFKYYGIELKVILIEFIPRKYIITNLNFISKNVEFISDDEE